MFFSARLRIPIDVALSAAGATSSAIATPTDVLKVRMQVHGRGMGDQMGLVGCFRQIYQQEGIAGLWRVRSIVIFIGHVLQ